MFNVIVKFNYTDQLQSCEWIIAFIMQFILHHVISVLISSRVHNFVHVAIYNTSVINGSFLTLYCIMKGTDQVQGNRCEPKVDDSVVYRPIALVSNSAWSPGQRQIHYQMDWQCHQNQVHTLMAAPEHRTWQDTYL